MASANSHSTESVIKRLSDNLRDGRDTLVAGRRGSYRSELVHRTAEARGMAVAELYLLGEHPLSPDVPLTLAEDPIESGVRQLLGDDDLPTDVDDGGDVILSSLPEWFSRVSAEETGVLLLRDLAPPRSPDDCTLDDLERLIGDRSFGGLPLPDGVVVVVTSDPTKWDSYRLEGFCGTVVLDLVHWAGLASDTNGFIKLITGPSDDPFDGIDFQAIIRGDSA